MKMKFLKIIGLGFLFFLSNCSNHGQAPQSNPGTGSLVSDDQSPHPRLLIRKDDLPELRQRYNSNNSMSKALQALKQIADFRAKTVAKFDTGNPQVVMDPAACKNLVQAPSPSDPNKTIKVIPFCDWGNFQMTNDSTEQYALFYALMYLLEQKPEDGKMARNIVMWVANQVAQGFDDSQPFREYTFPSKNRGSEGLEGIILAFDWAYDAFSQSDKETLNLVFTMWADSITHGSYGSSLWQDIKGNVANLLTSAQLLDIKDHPDHMANYIVTDHRRSRWGMNNYVSGGTKNLFLMVHAMQGLDFDPVTIKNANVNPPKQVFQKLSDYNQILEGGALARLYAFFTQDGVGGLAPESPYGYGEITMKNYLMLRIALQTLASKGLYTPPPPLDQLTSLPAWDRGLDGIIAGIANMPEGDNLHWPYSFYHVASIFQQDSDVFVSGLDSVLAGWAVYEHLLKGDPVHDKNYKKALWTLTNASFTGPNHLYNRVSQSSGSIYYGGISGYLPALMFLAYDFSFDPLDQNALPDPRNTGDIPLNFLDPGMGRIISRNQFGANGSWFHSNCSYASIDHMGVGEIGGFSLNRKGDYVTKVLTGYSQNFELDKAGYNNTLALLNGTTYPQGNNFQKVFFDSGTQLTGDPVSTVTLDNKYIYSQCDLTNVYNQNLTNTPDFLIQKYTQSGLLVDNVTHASRSLVWIKPDNASKSDYIVVYDRATTKDPGLFKRFNVTLYPEPAPSAPVNGMVSGQTKGGQEKYYIQNLLPKNAQVSLADLPGEKRGDGSDFVPGFEPIMIKDTSVTPAKVVWPKVFQAESTDSNVQLLNVIQASDNLPGVLQTKMTSIQSSPASNEAFDGVQIGNMVVMFRKDITSNLPNNLTLIYTASGAQSHMITGLEPNTVYQYNISGNTVSIGGGALQGTTNSEGVLIIGSVSSPG